jgi:hypothetical protein
MNGLLEENKPENTERKIYPTLRKKEPSERLSRLTIQMYYAPLG